MENDLAQAEAIYQGNGTYMGLTGEALRDYIYKLRAKVRGCDVQEGSMEITKDVPVSKPSKSTVGKLKLSDNGRR